MSWLPKRDKLDPVQASTERARTCDVVEFFSGIQGDYEQGELL